MKAPKPGEIVDLWFGNRTKLSTSVDGQSNNKVFVVTNTVKPVFSESNRVNLSSKTFEDQQTEEFTL